MTRARLGLEQLDARSTPSSLAGSDLGMFSPVAPADVGVITTPPSSPPLTPLDGQSGPQIVNFAGVEVSSGWFMFTGTVQDNTTTSGLSVTFDGVTSLEGKSAVTNSDGSFSLLVQVRTDGSDAGTVTAVTTDTMNLTSNTAWCDITPT